MYSSISFILIFVFVGLPVWWKTTTVYRVNLPYDEIETMSTKVATHLIQVEVVHADPRTPVANELVRRLEAACKQEATDTDEVQFVYKWSFREAYQNETGLFTKELTDVDEALHKTGHFSSRNRLYVVIVPQESIDATTVIGLHQIVYVKAGTGPDQLSKNIVDAVRKHVVQESALRRLWTSQKVTERAKLDKERMRPLSAATEFDVTFTLVVPEPQTLDVSWRIQDAVEVYLKPFLDKISMVARVHVKSQVLYLLPLKLKRRYSETKKAYVVTADQLSLMINPIEGSTSE